MLVFRILHFLILFLLIFLLLNFSQFLVKWIIQSPFYHYWLWRIPKRLVKHRLSSKLRIQLVPVLHISQAFSSIQMNVNNLTPWLKHVIKHLWKLALTEPQLWQIEVTDLQSRTSPLKWANSRPVILVLCMQRPSKTVNHVIPALLVLWLWNSMVVSTASPLRAGPSCEINAEIALFVLLVSFCVPCV